MNNKNIVSVIVICLIVAGLSFWSGMTYSKNKSATSLASRQGAFTQNGGRGGMRGGAGLGGGVVTGTVLSKDATSLTIELRAPNSGAKAGTTTTGGGSKIVLIAPSTQVDKTVSGAVTDVAVGSQVTVIGTTNTDGSVSATSIQLRPTTATPGK